MTKRTLIKNFKEMSKNNGVKLRLKKNYSGGFYSPFNRTIIIGIAGNIEWTASVFFHELAHVINYDNKKFPIYHSIKELNKSKPSTNFLRTAYRAEVYTEKVGKFLMKKYYSNLKYKVSYDNSHESKAQFKDSIIKMFNND